MKEEGKREEEEEEQKEEKEAELEKRKLKKRGGGHNRRAYCLGKREVRSSRRRLRRGELTLLWLPCIHV